MQIHGKILQTKNKLYEALDDLIEEKEISLITVTELCSKAEVDRSTFYRYYSLPQDVLDEQAAIIIDTALENASKFYSDDPLEDAKQKMLVFCSSYYENRHLTRLYNDLSKKTYLYIQRFLKNTRNHSSQELEDNIVFISGGVINVLNNWSNEGFQKSPRVVADTLTRQISKFA